jgi:hypothetical protein
MSKRFLYGLLTLVLSALACEPVIAIGRNELLCLLVLIVILLGPALYRFARRVDEFFRREKKNK